MYIVTSSTPHEASHADLLRNDPKAIVKLLAL